MGMFIKRQFGGALRRLWACSPEFLSSVKGGFYHWMQCFGTACDGRFVKYILQVILSLPLRACRKSPKAAPKCSARIQTADSFLLGQSLLQNPSFDRNSQSKERLPRFKVFRTSVFRGSLNIRPTFSQGGGRFVFLPLSFKTLLQSGRQPRKVCVQIGFTI